MRMKLIIGAFLALSGCATTPSETRSISAPVARFEEPASML